MNITLILIMKTECVYLKKKYFVLGIKKKHEILNIVQFINY